MKLKVIIGYVLMYLMCVFCALGIVIFLKIGSLLWLANAIYAFSIIIGIVIHENK